MSLENEAQVILRSQEDGRPSCGGFTGLSVVNPAYIDIVAAGSAAALASAAALRQELEREIQALDTGVQRVALACGEAAADPGAGPMYGGPTWRHVLVVVGDEKTPISWPPDGTPWPAGDAELKILPVLPLAAKAAVTSLLPSALREVNVELWSRSVAEAIPALLSLAGLTSESPRIFISYRQKESAGLAMQLFDALAHQNFDVFLDHFRIDPGINFQARLTQELGDKSMVLLIESAGILDSEWTTYEINVAKECGLGILALHPPGGKQVPGVDEAVRIRLGLGDFVDGAFTAEAVLAPAAVAGVVDRVQREHDRSLVRRRRLLRSSFEDALLLAGVSGRWFYQQGVLHISPTCPLASQPNPVEYRVWLTPRPPDLEDFHSTCLLSEAPLRGVVVGLCRLMEPPRVQRTDWLANLCKLRVIDEGRLKDAAAAIARGEL
jgi:hypothetical protein